MLTIMLFEAFIVSTLLLHICFLISNLVLIVSFHYGYQSISKWILLIISYTYILYEIFQSENTIYNPTMLFNFTFMFYNCFIEPESKLIGFTFISVNAILLGIRLVFYSPNGYISVSPVTVKKLLISNILFLIVNYTFKIYSSKAKYEYFRKFDERNTCIEKIIKEKSTFFACMSHEIRNPLQCLVGAVELLECSDGVNQKKFIKIIKGGCELILGLISNILDVSKIEATKMDLLPVPSSLTKNIEEIVKFLSGRAKLKDIELTYKEYNYIPPCLKFDPKRLHQVIINLVSNAIKFTKEGKVVITSSWRSLNENEDISKTISKELRESNWNNILAPINEIDDDEEAGLINRISTKSSYQFVPSHHESKQLSYISPKGSLRRALKDRIRAVRRNTTITKDKDNALEHFGEEVKGIIKIEVMDTGIGISKQAREKLFKPYQQADPSISQNYGGTGLGLWISHNIIKLMKGDIFIKSKQAFGTNVIVAFPSVTCPEAEVFNKKCKMPSLLNIENTFLLGKRCMIVDDIPENTLLLREAFSRHGLSTVCFTKAKEAIKAYKKGRDFDIIVTDLRLPEMTGQYLMSEIRSYEQKNGLSKIPIVVLTGESAQNIKVECLGRYGADEYLIKPINFEILMKSIENSINKRKSNQKNILVIDDDIMSQKVIVNILDILGAKVKCCFSIKEGKESFINDSMNYDLILLDNQLPDGTGLDFMSFYKKSEKSKLCKKVPVVSMSGNSVSDQKRIYSNYEMNGFLEKPVLKEVLSGIIKSIE